MTNFLLVAGAALVLATVSPFVLVPLLERAGMVDIPNQRSSHSHRALRGAGVAQAIAIGTALAVAMLAIDGTRDRLVPLLIAILAASALGWAEDFHGLSVQVRAGFQLVVGVAVFFVCALRADEPWWWVLLGGVALVGLVNVVNFMDGVNGMSAAHGTIAGLTFAVLGARHDVDWLLASGLAVAAAYLGFLPWNYDGRLFLGDVGSYLLGAASSVVIVLGWMDGLPLLALAAPFAIYVADTGVTLAGRVAAREPWHEAHRDHTYQRLNRRGLPHLGVTTVLALASACCAALGLVAAEGHGLARALALVCLLLIVSAYTALRFVLGAPRTDDRTPHS